MTADTSQLVAPSGMFILSSNITEVMLFLYVLLWKSVEALLLPQALIIGRALNVAVIVLFSVTAPPVIGLVSPDTYPPDQFSKEQLVFGVAVAFTVSPYLTVSTACAVEAVTLLFGCITASAFTVPFVGLVNVTVYVFLLNHI